MYILHTTQKTTCMFRKGLSVSVHIFPRNLNNGQCVDVWRALYLNLLRGWVWGRVLSYIVSHSPKPQNVLKTFISYMQGKK